MIAKTDGNKIKKKPTIGIQPVTTVKMIPIRPVIKATIAVPLPRIRGVLSA
jgi:hypothetical protein